MIVISDTTPVISFLKMNRLDILQKLFGEVLLPEAVYRELISNEYFREEADRIREAPFLKKVKVEDRNAVTFLMNVTGLDLGESESIICYEENHCDLLIVDEVKARKTAQNMKIRITGTIGILTVANERGILTKEDAIKCVKILRESHRHISEALLEHFIDNLK